MQTPAALQGLSGLFGSPSPLVPGGAAAALGGLPGFDEATALVFAEAFLRGQAAAAPPPAPSQEQQQLHLLHLQQFNGQTGATQFAVVVGQTRGPVTAAAAAPLLATPPASAFSAVAAPGLASPPDTCLPVGATAFGMVSAASMDAAGLGANLGLDLDGDGGAAARAASLGASLGGRHDHLAGQLSPLRLPGTPARLGTPTPSALDVDLFCTGPQRECACLCACACAHVGWGGWPARPARALVPAALAGNCACHCALPLLSLGLARGLIALLDPDLSRLPPSPCLQRSIQPWTC